MTDNEMAERLRRWFAEAAPRGVVSAYLYGSHAEQRAHRESDVDIGVLLDWSEAATPGQRFACRLELTGALIGALKNNAVDLVILNDVPPGLARRVVCRGIRLCCAVPELDHAFVRDVQLRAADLDPFLQRFREKKLKRLARS